jgi:hypothetical protein
MKFFIAFGKPSMLVAAVICLAASHLGAQEKIAVKFKIFDTNVPTKALDPVRKANIFVRDPVTKKPTFLDAEDVKELADKFFEVRVAKGWLVEQMVIYVNDPQKDYNPAFLTKVVSAADMLVYPGASKSTDEFAFQAFLAQMSAYRAFLAQLLDEVEPSLHERVRTNLRTAFETQLRNMGDIDRRLPRAKVEERNAAAKLRDEVFRLYGLLPPEQPAEQIVECFRLCGRFGFFRRR